MTKEFESCIKRQGEFFLQPFTQMLSIHNTCLKEYSGHAKLIHSQLVNPCESFQSQRWCKEYKECWRWHLNWQRRRSPLLQVSFKTLDVLSSSDYTLRLSNGQELDGMYILRQGDQICPSVALGGNCPSGDTCGWAHCFEEIAQHPARFKTKPCDQKGRCRGRICKEQNLLLCTQAHGGEDSRTNASTQIYQQKNSKNINDLVEGLPVQDQTAAMEIMQALYQTYFQKNNGSPTVVHKDENQINSHPFATPIPEQLKSMLITTQQVTNKSITNENDTNTSKETCKTIEVQKSTDKEQLSPLLKKNNKFSWSDKDLDYLNYLGVQVKRECLEIRKIDLKMMFDPSKSDLNSNYVWNVMLSIEMENQMVSPKNQWSFVIKAIPLQMMQIRLDAYVPNKKLNIRLIKRDTKVEKESWIIYLDNLYEEDKILPVQLPMDMEEGTYQLDQLLEKRGQDKLNWSCLGLVRIGIWLEWDIERLIWISHYKKGRFSSLERKSILLILSFLADASYSTDENYDAFLKDTVSSVRAQKHKALSKPLLPKLVSKINLILVERKTHVQQTIHVIQSIYEIHKYNNSLSVNHLHSEFWRMMEKYIVLLLLDKKEMISTSAATMIYNLQSLDIINLSNSIDSFLEKLIFSDRESLMNVFMEKTSIVASRSLNIMQMIFECIPNKKSFLSLIEWLQKNIDKKQTQIYFIFKQCLKNYDWKEQTMMTLFEAKYQQITLIITNQAPTDIDIISAIFSLKTHVDINKNDANQNKQDNVFMFDDFSQDWNYFDKLD